MLDDQQTLAALLPQLHTVEWIALDSEADSLHAYPEKLCLLQLSFPGADVLIDPLAGLDLAGLWEAFCRHELILHGADYDLRLLNRSYEFVPKVVFDTMEAARLLGCTEFGLTHLVAKYLGVALEKGPQKANWALRPLTKAMEVYARNDTRYLQPLAEILKAGLQRTGRLAWHQESCARLVAECAQLRPPDPDRIWRIKGSYRLHRRELALLRELWHWREQEAVRANKPPFFVLSHETLISVTTAAARAETVDGLLPRRFSPLRRATLSAAIARGLALSPAEFPEAIRPASRHPSQAERRRFEALKTKRDRQASELGIDPTLIASRGTLELLARDGEWQSAVVMNWQLELLQ